MEWYGATCSKNVTVVAPCSPSWYCQLDAYGGRTGTAIDRNSCGGSPTINCTPTNNASCRSVSAPSEVLEGETFSSTVTMRNTGTKTWRSNDGTPHRLGGWNPQDSTLWNSGRVNMPTTYLGPNRNLSFTFNAMAPNSPGVKNFDWRMLEESIQWFGGACTSKNITVYKPLPYPSNCNADYQLSIYNEDIYKSDPASSLIYRSATQSSNTFNWNPATGDTSILDINDKTLRYEVTSCFDTFDCTKEVSGECVNWTFDNQSCQLIGLAIKDYDCPVPELISFDPNDIELSSLDDQDPQLPLSENVSLEVKCTDGTTLPIVPPNSNLGAGNVDWDLNDLQVCSTGFEINSLGGGNYQVNSGVTVLGKCEDVAILTIDSYLHNGFDWGSLIGRLNVSIVGGTRVAEEFVYSGDLLVNPPPGFEKLYLPELVE